jgi:hypothetical protein
MAMTKQQKALLSSLQATIDAAQQWKMGIKDIDEVLLALASGNTIVEAAREFST